MRKSIRKIKSKVNTKKELTLNKTTTKEKEIPQVRLVGLENIKPPAGAHKKRKLLGRGSSSGHGKTSTRGVKGQTSRAGRDFYLGFEGGQTPLIRRIPKRGFSNLRFKKRYQVVNLEDLKRVKDNTVTPEILEEVGLIRDANKLIKILGEGELARPLTIKAHAFSKKAKQLIEQTGGKIEILSVLSKTEA